MAREENLKTDNVPTVLTEHTLIAAMTPYLT